MVDFKDEQESKEFSHKALKKAKELESKQILKYSKVIRGVLITTNSKERLEEYEEMLNKRILIKG
jgi:hypothetical protein